MQFVCMVTLLYFDILKSVRIKRDKYIVEFVKYWKKMPKNTQKWQKITKKWLKIAKKWQKFAVTLGLILYVYD